MTRSTIFFLSILVAVPAFAGDRPDSTAMAMIIEEGMQRSQVMDHLALITEVYGPRLTASPGYLRAARWAAERLKEFGLVDSHLEGWGPFGTG